MHLLKHKLTEEEKEYVKNCLDFINSNDFETSTLGISLFYEKFNTYRFPIKINGFKRLLKIRPSKGIFYRNLIEDVFNTGYCYY